MHSILGRILGRNRCYVEKKLNNTEGPMIVLTRKEGGILEGSNNNMYVRKEERSSTLLRLGIENRTSVSRLAAMNIVS